MVADKGRAVCAFESQAILADVRNRVAWRLAGAHDAAAVKAVFEEELGADVNRC